MAIAWPFRPPVHDNTVQLICHKPWATITIWPLTLTQVTFDLDTWPLVQTILLLNLLNKPKIMFFGGLVTLTFDLWPWPSRSTKGSSAYILWPNFMTLGAVFSRYELLPSEFLSSHFVTDRRTDRKRRIWAHRAWAQVGSKKLSLYHTRERNYGWLKVGKHSLFSPKFSIKSFWKSVIWPEKLLFNDNSRGFCPIAILGT